MTEHRGSSINQNHCALRQSISEACQEVTYLTISGASAVRKFEPCKEQPKTPTTIFRPFLDDDSKDYFKFVEGDIEGSLQSSNGEYILQEKYRIPEEATGMVKVLTNPGTLDEKQFTTWWKHTSLEQDFYIETESELTRIHVVPRKSLFKARLPFGIGLV